MPRIPFGDWVNDVVQWMLVHLDWLFGFFESIFNGVYDGLTELLQAPEPLLLAGIFAVVAFWLRGTVGAVLAFVGLWFIQNLELWDKAMETLSLVLVSTLIALIIGVPLGIWAARSNRVSNLFRPVLDL
ncbi:glycine/betaine ABC transporter permease, partial [Streptomyces endophyticus]|nr:glycine/betaine ABC transporter permease [Streptomyces endophyticus]